MTDVTEQSILEGKGSGSRYTWTRESFGLSITDQIRADVVGDDAF